MERLISFHCWAKVCVESLELDSPGAKGCTVWDLLNPLSQFDRGYCQDVRVCSSQSSSALAENCNVSQVLEELLEERSVNFSFKKIFCVC